jgi:hypothetical protein
MSPHDIIAAFEKHGNMTNVAKIGSNDYQGTRKGKTITAKIRKYRGKRLLLADYIGMSSISLFTTI